MIFRSFLLGGFVGALIASAIAAEGEPSAFALARKSFSTRVTRPSSAAEEPETPPAASKLQLVKYEGPEGIMAAYVSASPKDGRRHPAIVWLVGGFSNGIGDIAWTPGPKENDQSATGFRDAGVIMMYPALRGGCGGLGFRESFYGEVDDVIAATRHLASLDYVDPQRIYLGGHSTGGTLALLVSAASDQYRAVFAFGPVGDVRGYGADVLTFNPKNVMEVRMRAPVRWLDLIRRPTFVFEGTVKANHDELVSLREANRNPRVTFHPVPGGTHFTIIQPLVKDIARQIVADSGPTATFDFKALPRFEGAPK